MDFIKEKERFKDSLFLPFCFVIVMWAVKLIEIGLSLDFSKWGVFPRETFGLKGILFYPFIHGDMQHLFGNTLPVVILGFIVIYSYSKVAWKVIPFIFFVSGIGIWLFARPSYHIGASGLIYGLAFYIFFSGVFRKDIASIALALVVALFYGGMVWGLLPIQPGVSFEGHLAGAIAGVYCAFYYRKTNLPKKKVWPAEVEKENIEAPFWQEKPKLEKQIMEVTSGADKQKLETELAKLKVKYHYKKDSID